MNDSHGFHPDGAHSLSIQRHKAEITKVIRIKNEACRVSCMTSTCVSLASCLPVALLSLTVSPQEAWVTPGTAPKITAT